MTSINVKLLNEINHNFTKLLEQYSDNYKVLKQINEYINTKLPVDISKIHRDVENLEKIEKEKNYFINKFLSSMDNIFYYINENDVFVHYDMKHYKIFEEDQLINQIYNEITENHISLHSSKFIVLSEIINELKQQSLLKCLPESYTIQSIIKYLMTYFFSSKDDAKYFCCVLGDIILNKNIDIIVCVNSTLLSFIEMFDSIMIKGLGKTISNGVTDKFISNNIVNSTKISNHRIIRSNNEDQQYLWSDFLRKHAIDLLAVSIHYSKRYVNSENYLSHHKTPEGILYLKRNSPKQMIEGFCLKNFNVDKNHNISYENMEYLWYNFLCKQHIPSNIVSQTELHDTIKSYIKYDNDNKTYVSIFHKDIQLIEDLKQFIKSELIVDVNDELEVSELTAIFEEQGHHYTVDEKTMINMVKYFTNCSITSDNKIICDTRCKMWDKKGDLNNFINIMKQGATSNYPIVDDLSINDIYTKYCKYTSNNGNVRKIVTKKYFVNYILHNVPEQYIMFNKVVKDFWYE